MPLPRNLLPVSLLLALGACTAGPYPITPPADVARAVTANAPKIEPLGPFDYDPRPIALAICYNNAVDEPAEVIAAAAERCPNEGQLTRVDGDWFWNGCSMSQPSRATFVCTPGPPPPGQYQ